MFWDYVDNIFSLLVIFFAMMVSVTRYINDRKVGWLLTSVLYSSYLLSSYLWSAYYIIMTEDPDGFGDLVNFGWNAGFFVLAILSFIIKSPEERRYLHPLMLLPIPLNLWQLKLYLDIEFSFNSIYEVTICTVVSCLSVQGIMYYIRERKNGAKFPYFSVAALLNMITEFGMWTSTCFDGWVWYLYYPFTIMNSLCYLLVLRAVRKTYPEDESDRESHLDNKVRNILKGVYITVVMLGAAGGILLGSWIRDVLKEEVSVSVVEEVTDLPGEEYETEVLTEDEASDGEEPEDEEESEENAEDESGSAVNNVITIVLFLSAVVVAVFAVIMVFIIYFEQKVFENNKLREATQIAERSNAAKSDFLANMSHEIRTPINAVLGMNKMIMTESIRARDDLPTDREEARKVFSDITGYAANIDSAGNNLLCIINDILDFSKIEAGKLEIVEREYKLSSVLNDVSNTVRFRAKDKGLDFRADSDADIPDELFGDEVRIRQIMTNLLNNAVKYTDKGSVALSVFGGGKQRYQAGSTVELIITVKDTGIGIKKEDIGKLFGKFERMDLEHNSTIEGTGLGLAITHRLLTMMNGTISVDSEYGKGTVFTARIPQRIVSAAPIGNFREKFEKSVAEISADKNIFRAPDAHILVVDDTRMNLIVAVGLLKDTQIAVDTAESGAEALQMTLVRSYDAILMDQRMPEMDGVETMHKLRARGKGNDLTIPVICLTADAISGAKERYIAEGFNDYLSKPIDSEELKKMLMRFLPAEKVITVQDDDKAKRGPAKAPVKPEPVKTTEKPGTLFEALESAGVDVRSGLGFCYNNEELYRDLLVEYVKAADGKTRDINGSFDDGDWKNYGIRVHSLKSVSRTIGLQELADTAAMLEKAADEGDTELIEKEHAGFMESYRKAVSALVSAGVPSGGETSGEDTSDDDEILEFMPKQ
ncbi:MAG: response regulator [Ruminiclostridium sp.]|nr:response regulator [Ruminiclostridium sp.]